MAKELLSKEEIIKNTVLTIGAASVGGHVANIVSEAMDIWGKQEAIAFASFCVDWFEDNGKVEPFKRWRSVRNGEDYTTNGVYELFLIEQSKTVNK